MGEVTWLINCTIDGRCGHQDVIADDDLHNHAEASLEGIDIVLFGRRTFELLEPHWSAIAHDQSGTDAENHFALAIDAKPKIVFSRTASTVGWNGRVVATVPAEEVQRLVGQGERLLIQASPGLAGELGQAGLIDRYRFLLQPIIAGEGPPLFTSGANVAIDLINATPFASGAVALDYARRPKTAHEVQR